MARFGFCSGFYTSTSVRADAQTIMNFYPEAIESGMGTSAMALYPTPGLKLFASMTGAQVRGEWTINGRSFAVIDAKLVEILANGTLTALGSVVDDGNPVSMVASPAQLAVTSGGFLYVYMLRANGSYTAGQFITVPPYNFPGPVSQVNYSDSFFVVLVVSTEQYYASNSFDATTWPPLSTGIIETFPDNVVSMVVDHREVWLFGAKSSEVDYDAGNFPFPFATVPGGFIEEGCGAQFATVQLDNGIFWIGSRNDRGGGIGWRTNGYSPQRVTTHAIENAWQSYPTIADARAFSYQSNGHSFWHITFPTAGATWVYDVAAGLWHERGSWFEQAGIFQAALPQCHTYNFGKHLVGDRSSGNIYDMEIPSQAVGGGWNFVTDNGALIRRVRRSPHISNEQQWMRGGVLQVFCETGLGPIPPLLDGAGQPRDPMMTLRISRDGGHTWSGGRDAGAGQAGDFLSRVMYRRLGRWRDAVAEISVSDPIPWRIIDAYLGAESGAAQFKPQERLANQLAKVS